MAPPIHFNSTHTYIPSTMDTTAHPRVTWAQLLELSEQERVTGQKDAWVKTAIWHLQSTVIRPGSNARNDVDFVAAASLLEGLLQSICNLGGSIEAFAVLLLSSVCKTFPLARLQTLLKVPESFRIWSNQRAASTDLDTAREIAVILCILTEALIIDPTCGISSVIIAVGDRVLTMENGSYTKDFWKNVVHRYYCTLFLFADRSEEDARIDDIVEILCRLLQQYRIFDDTPSVLISSIARYIDFVESINKPRREQSPTRQFRDALVGLQYTFIDMISFSKTVHEKFMMGFQSTTVLIGICLDSAATATIAGGLQTHVCELLMKLPVDSVISCKRAELLIGSLRTVHEQYDIRLDYTFDVVRQICIRSRGASANATADIRSCLSEIRVACIDMVEAALKGPVNSTNGREWLLLPQSTDNYMALCETCLSSPVLLALACELVYSSTLERDGDGIPDYENDNSQTPGAVHVSVTHGAEQSRPAIINRAVKSVCTAVSRLNQYSQSAGLEIMAALSRMCERDCVSPVYEDNIKLLIALYCSFDVGPKATKSRGASAKIEWYIGMVSTIQAVLHSFHRYLLSPDSCLRSSAGYGEDLGTISTKTSEILCLCYSAVVGDGTSTDRRRQRERPGRGALGKTGNTISEKFARLKTSFGLETEDDLMSLIQGFLSILLLLLRAHGMESAKPAIETKLFQFLAQNIRRPLIFEDDVILFEMECECLLSLLSFYANKGTAQRGDDNGGDIYVVLSGILAALQRVSKNDSAECPYSAETKLAVYRICQQTLRRLCSIRCCSCDNNVETEACALSRLAALIPDTMPQVFSVTQELLSNLASIIKLL
jgi:hypothetical protein